MVPVEIRPQMLYNPTMRSPNFFVPGVIGVVLQIGTTFATAMAVVRERERGTLEQLLVSPLSRWGLMLGQTDPLSLHRDADGVSPFWDHAFRFLRPHRREHRGDGPGDVGLRFRAPQPRPARCDQSRKPDASPANVDGVYPARVFFSPASFSRAKQCRRFSMRSARFFRRLISSA